ncbi:hypothetical protein HDV00_012567 [Rhizophlyctis rosea]|nr:hypothetical protein HDV00_012567 [Rhizophlyctis rosea]
MGRNPPDSSTFLLTSIFQPLSTSAKSAPTEDSTQVIEVADGVGNDQWAEGTSEEVVMRGWLKFRRDSGTAKDRQTYYFETPNEASRLAWFLAIQASQVSFLVGRNRALERDVQAAKGRMRGVFDGVGEGENKDIDSLVTEADEKAKELKRISEWEAKSLPSLLNIFPQTSISQDTPTSLSSPTHSQPLTPTAPTSTPTASQTLRTRRVFDSLPRTASHSADDTSDEAFNAPGFYPVDSQASRSGTMRMGTVRGNLANLTMGRRSFDALNDGGGAEGGEPKQQGQVQQEKVMKRASSSKATLRMRSGAGVGLGSLGDLMAKSPMGSSPALDGGSVSVEDNGNVSAPSAHGEGEGGGGAGKMILGEFEAGGVGVQKEDNKSDGEVRKGDDSALGDWNGIKEEDETNRNSDTLPPESPSKSSPPPSPTHLHRTRPPHLSTSQKNLSISHTNLSSPLHSPSTSISNIFSSTASLSGKRTVRVVRKGGSVAGSLADLTAGSPGVGSPGVGSPNLSAGKAEEERTSNAKRNENNDSPAATATQQNVQQAHPTPSPQQSIPPPTQTFQPLPNVVPNTDLHPPPNPHIALPAPTTPASTLTTSIQYKSAPSLAPAALPPAPMLPPSKMRAKPPPAMLGMAPVLTSKGSPAVGRKVNAVTRGGGLGSTSSLLSSSATIESPVTVNDPVPSTLPPPPSVAPDAPTTPGQ